MHNVNVEAVEQSAATAKHDPNAVIQHVMLEGEWDSEPGKPQFRTAIPVPNGEPVVFQADFPPAMGGTGSAPNPLAYCFWGGLACYAMTFAQEAARRGIALRALHARIQTNVDLSGALGVSDRPPVERIDWYLDADTDADATVLQELKQLADEHCPGAYCIRNPIALHTHVKPAQ